MRKISEKLIPSEIRSMETVTCDFCGKECTTDLYGVCTTCGRDTCWQCGWVGGRDTRCNRCADLATTYAPRIDAAKRRCEVHR